VHIRDIKVLDKSASDLSNARGNFAIAKSRNRFSAMAMDQNYEQCATVKGRGGTVAMIQNEESMRRWMITQPKLMELPSDFHEEIGMSNDKLSWLHHEEGKSFQDRFREELDRLMPAFKNRGNPFEERACE